MTLLRILTLVQFLCVFGLVSCNKCTNVLSRDKVQEVVIKDPCIQSYTARCGWLSLNYCTFYHQTYCDKKVNETIKIYYVVTDCCKGYMLAADGTCIKKQPGMIYPTTPKTLHSSVNPDYKHEPIRASKNEPTTKTEMSGGAYAGIGCGLVLFASITIFVVIAVRKRKRKKLPTNNLSTHRMFVPSPPSNPSIGRTIYTPTNCNTPLTMETTSSPGSSLAPLITSPVRTIPVHTTYTDMKMNDIPESDI